MSGELLLYVPRNGSERPTAFSQGILPVLRSPSPIELFENLEGASPIINADSPAPDCNVPPAPGDIRAPIAPEPVCRICLRTGIAMAADMDDTLDMFYDELIYFDSYEHEALSYCLVCEYQLRRLYNFRQKCRRAHILLKTKGADLFGPEGIKTLQGMIPRPSIGICTAKSKQMVYFTKSKANNLENPTEDVPDELNENKDESNITCLDNYSLLIKKIGCDDFLKLEKGGLYSIEYNYPETDLKRYIQDFLKTDEDSACDVHCDDNNDHKEVRTMQRKTKKKRNKIPKPILTRAEKTIIRRRKSMERYKEWVLRLLKRGELEGIEDLGQKINEEVLIKLLDKCPMGSFVHAGLRQVDSKIPKTRRFLQSLLKKNNPLFEDMFVVTYLNTEEKQIEEFKARQHSLEYKEAAFKCDICYQWFDIQGLLDYHMKWHDESKPHVCSICSMRFHVESRLKSHVTVRHREKYSCKLCPFVTYGHETMRSHYRDHKRVLYTCPECNEQFCKIKSMQNHVRHTHRSNSICSLCGHRLPSDVQLKRHIVQEHSDVPAATLASPPAEGCNKCKAAFYSQEALLQHAATSHRSTSRVEKKEFYSCFYCKVRCETVEALCTHKRSKEHREMMLHTGGRPKKKIWQAHRTCTLCNIQVENKHPRSLYEHYRAEHPAAAYLPEEGARPFLCEHCGKTFLLKHSYKDHLNLHSGAKPYECSDCGARFACRTSAHKHLHSHRGNTSKMKRKYNGSYICNICAKVFTLKRNLVRHLQAHTGEKPYMCPLCNQQFTQASSVKLHITTVHLKLPTPYKSRSRAERPTRPKKPWKPRAGLVPPMSLELLQSYVLEPWKNDLDLLKAVLDANNREVDESDANEEDMRDVSYEEEVRDTQIDATFDGEEEVIEEPCYSD